MDNKNNQPFSETGENGVDPENLLPECLKTGMNQV